MKAIVKEVPYLLDGFYKVGDVIDVIKEHGTFFCSKFNFAFSKSDIELIYEDPIVNQVIDKFKQRSEKGIQTYGTTLHDNNTDDFLTHLQEELMDAVLYIQKLKDGNDRRD